MENLPKYLIQFIISFLSYIRQNLEQFNPNNTTYLTISGSFCITILAIAIPLSVDSIGRLSNRYKSSIISKMFNSETDNNYLKITGFLLITLIIILTMFSPKNLIAVYIWRDLYYLSFVLNMFMIFLLYKFFHNLTQYFISTNYVFDKLIKKTNNIISEETIKITSRILCK